MKGVNWISVIIAVVLLQALGFVWYGMLFSDAWMAEMQAVGITPDMSTATQSMILGVAVTIVVVLGLSWLVQRLGASGLKAGLMAGLAAWFFFSLTTQALEYVYMGFTPTLMAINAGYQLLSYLIAGAVLSTVKFGKAAAPAAA